MPVTIASNPSGSGTFTITNPASASNRTLTLPDAAGTVMLTDTLATQAQLATALNASGSAPLYACRAWVNFNGTGTVAIRASGNVTSITDNGVGDYTVNFTTAMSDTNYAVKISGSKDSLYTWLTHPYIYATGNIRVRTWANTAGENQAPVLNDTTTVNVAIFR